MNSSSSYYGILDELISGRWVSPETGDSFKMPMKVLRIEDSLEGMESALVTEVHGGAKVCVVSDELTWEILGRRINTALGASAAEPLILRQPKADWETVERVRDGTSAPALVVVGSGTVTDLVKHATYISGREFSVFATSPMNAYTTLSASITINGTKSSLSSHGAKGAFFELRTLAGCPHRLLANAFGDVVCRSSAQIDWMFSRDFKGTFYSDDPFTLLADDEKLLLSSADKLLSGDRMALALLVRTCILNGTGSSIVGSTHPGSMAEHSISHYLDMCAGSSHPGSLHGEQVGVATLTVMRLQERILRAADPPRLAATADYSAALHKKYASGIADQFAVVCAAKALNAERAENWNDKWEKGWEEFAGSYRAVMQSADKVEKAFVLAGAPTRATDLGFDASFYRDAVRDARHFRERFSILDIAGDSGMLEGFLEETPV